MSFFSFDSRNNHLKHFETDTYAQSISGFTFAQTDTLTTHNLGYYPNVRVYQDFSGDVWPVTEYFWGTKKPDVRSSTWTTTTQLLMTSDNIEATTQTPTVYYRIYKDGDTTNKTSFSTFESIEKIEGTFTGSYTAAGSGAITTQTIPHNLGERHFAVLKWNDGGEDRDGDMPNYTGFTVDTNAIAHCDDTNVYVETYNGTGGDKTITYKVFLYKLEEDNILLDSRKATFSNFDEGEVDIVLSGSVDAGTTTEFTGSIVHTQGSSVGIMHLQRSDVASKEFTLPLPPLSLTVPTDGVDIGAGLKIEHAANITTVSVLVRNQDASARTITTATWTFRYALFVA